VEGDARSTEVGE
jgi:hypothetical protein